MTQRERVISYYDEPSEHWFNGDSFPRQDRFHIVGKQVTTSQSNAWPALRGSGQDVGSEFSTEKTSFKIDSPCAMKASRSVFGTPLYWYKGPIFSSYPDGMETLKAEADRTTFTTLDGMGATAISRVLPTNPATDAMTFAAELTSDGLPKAIGAQLWKQRSPKGAAGEYLNYQFGIAPTANDIMSLADTVSKSEKIMDQFARDSGRNIRRKYYFPTVYENSKSTSLFNRSPYCSGDLGDEFIAGGDLTTFRSVKRDVWFSGCFTYYLNLGKSQADRLEYAAQQAKRLYGVRLTPDVLWNVTPWSWAADWVTNMGDVLHNLSAFSTNGLVMRYGYVMEHYTMRESRIISGLRPHTYDPEIKVELSNDRVGETYTYERKLRRRATPFGFGLDPGQFTARQWSILGALGISRTSR